MKDDYLDTIVLLNMLVVKHTLARMMCDDEFIRSKHITFIKEYTRMIYILDNDDWIER